MKKRESFTCATFDEFRDNVSLRRLNEACSFAINKCSCRSECAKSMISSKFPLLMDCIFRQQKICSIYWWLYHIQFNWNREQKQNLVTSINKYFGYKRATSVWIKYHTINWSYRQRRFNAHLQKCLVQIKTNDRSNDTQKKKWNNNFWLNDLCAKNSMSIKRERDTQTHCSVRRQLDIKKIIYTQHVIMKQETELYIEQQHQQQRISHMNAEINVLSAINMHWIMLFFFSSSSVVGSYRFRA